MVYLTLCLCCFSSSSFFLCLLENPEGYERFMMTFLNLNARVTLSVGMKVSLPLTASGGPDGGCATVDVTSALQ